MLMWALPSSGGRPMVAEILAEFVLRLVGELLGAALSSETPRDAPEDAVRVARPRPAAVAHDLWDDEIDGPFNLRQP